MEITKRARSTDAVLLPINAVFACYRPFRFKIGEEWKVQIAVLGEGCVAPHAVYRDAQKLRVQATKLWKDLIVKRHLISTDRTKVCRIKGEDYGTAMKLS